MSHPLNENIHLHLQLYLLRRWQENPCQGMSYHLCRESLPWLLPKTQMPTMTDAPLQGWVSHHGHLGLGQEAGQALPAEVVTHPRPRDLLPKPEQVQVQVEVDVLIKGMGHQCLWLGVLQAQRSDMPSVLASTQLAWCLWEGKYQVSISPQWIPGSWTCSTH